MIVHLVFTVQNVNLVLNIFYLFFLLKLNYYLECRSGKYGKNCEENCECYNGAKCEAETGKCKCAPGYLGANCQQEHIGQNFFLKKIF